MNKAVSTSLLILLASISALTPFATDGYLSALPVMAKELNTDISLVAITVSLYILGLAIGQLIGGPFSDKYGRKPIIMIGLLLFSISSFVIPLNHSIELLWIGRFFQAIGGGIAVVSVPAIVRDNAVGKDAAKLFSLIMLITMLAPSIAPSVGTLILTLLNWGWIFTSLGIFGVIVLFAVFFIMPENQKPSKDRYKSSYLSVFREKRALGFLISQSFAFSILLTFLTNVPFAYIEYFHVSEAFFSGLLLLNVLSVICINRLNNYLLNKFEPHQLLKSFLFMQFIGVSLLVFNTFFFPTQLWAAVMGFVVTTASIGGIIPNSSACFMNYFEKNAGIAAATLGATQYVTAAAISAIAAMLTHDSLWPMVLVMLVAVIIAFSGVLYKASSR